MHDRTHRYTDQLCAIIVAASKQDDEEEVDAVQSPPCLFTVNIGRRVNCAFCRTTATICSEVRCCLSSFDAGLSTARFSVTRNGFCRN